MKLPQGGTYLHHYTKVWGW